MPKKLTMHLLTVTLLFFMCLSIVQQVHISLIKEVTVDCIQIVNELGELILKE